MPSNATPSAGVLSSPVQGADLTSDSIFSVYASDADPITSGAQASFYIVRGQVVDPDTGIAAPAHIVINTTSGPTSTASLVSGGKDYFLVDTTQLNAFDHSQNSFEIHYSDVDDSSSAMPDVVLSGQVQIIADHAIIDDNIGSISAGAGINTSIRSGYVNGEIGSGTFSLEVEDLSEYHQIYSVQNLGGMNFVIRNSACLLYQRALRMTRWYPRRPARRRACAVTVIDFDESKSMTFGISSRRK